MEKGKKPLRIKELPKDARQINLINLQLLLRKTSKVYFYSIIGDHELLFKKIFVDNRWSLYKRLTLGGWELIKHLPEIAIPYKNNYNDRELEWKFKSLEGDEDHVYKEIFLEDKYWQLKKHIKG